MSYFFAIQRITVVIFCFNMSLTNMSPFDNANYNGILPCRFAGKDSRLL